MTSLASTTRYAALVVLAGGIFSQPAAAAPFCLQSEALPPQCIYYDASNCQRDAQVQQATCAANPKEIKMTYGVGQFCVIASSSVSICQFADRNSCTLEATRQRGTCVAAPEGIAPARTPDPFSPINGN